MERRSKAHVSHRAPGHVFLERMLCNVSFQSVLIPALGEKT